MPGTTDWGKSLYYRPETERTMDQEVAMGSLIPSEMWDWEKDWPKAVAGVAITLFLFGILAAAVLIW
jgi:hypothetical protein